VRQALFVVLAVLLGVPGWAGQERLPLWGPAPQLSFQRVPLDASDPRRTRLGALTYLGGLHLTSDDVGFGGFSSMSVVGTRFLLLSDGGLTLRFNMNDDFVPRDARFGALPDGPASGWSRIDRDAEALTLHPATGQAWVAFENHNSIWRYSPGLRRAEAHHAPTAMRRWWRNGGPEAMVRLRSGRFVVIAEGAGFRKSRDTRDMLVFDGDPTDPDQRVVLRSYRPPAGFSPTGAAEMPDGRLLVLNRAVSLRDGFIAQLTLLDLTNGRGRQLARFEAPVLHDNFEGLAVTREGRDLILWILSDDNASWGQRTLLLKFKLEL
jgi:hypothetical protein